MIDYGVAKLAKKIGVALVGGVVVIVGLVAVPYPGPGWLIVFMGLGILSTEFVWAKRLLKYGQRKLVLWESWLKSQSRTVRAAILGLVCVVVIMTIWLLNGYGILMDITGVDIPWLHSPLL